MSCRWGCEGWGGWGEGPGTLAPRGAGRLRMRGGLRWVGSGWQSADWGGGRRTVARGRCINLQVVTLYTYGAVHPEFHERLTALLRDASTRLAVAIEPVPAGIAKVLGAWSGDSCLVSTISEMIGDTSRVRLLCVVAPESGLARWCTDTLPLATWGCALSGFIAVEYAPPQSALVTQLHEVFHCLGVDDCYDEKTLQPKSSCVEDECLMRYGSGGLVVCESVSGQLSTIADVGETAATPLPRSPVL